eukprot:jgi/Botrbrau1/5157/Bobra.0172s0029.1
MPYPAIQVLPCISYVDPCVPGYQFPGTSLSYKTVVEPCLTCLMVLLQASGYWQIYGITFSNLNLPVPPPSSSGEVCFTAGKGILKFSEPCWSCVDHDNPGFCWYVYGNTASIDTYGLSSVANLTTRVGVLGGGPYRLSYALENNGDKFNSFQAIVGSVNGSFAPIVLESLSDSRPFLKAVREFPFTVQNGTRVITVTFLVNAGQPFEISDVQILVGSAPPPLRPHNHAFKQVKLPATFL